jgi:hypothetical protein
MEDKTVSEEGMNQISEEDLDQKNLKNSEFDLDKLLQGLRQHTRACKPPE